MFEAELEVGAGHGMVGALSDEDCEMLAMISEDAIDRHDGEDAAVMMMRSDTGRCVFVQIDGQQAVTVRGNSDGD